MPGTGLLLDCKIASASCSPGVLIPIIPLFFDFTAACPAATILPTRNSDSFGNILTVTFTEPVSVFKVIGIFFKYLLNTSVAALWLSVVAKS